MKTNLTKRNRTLLLTAAGIMLIAWMMPFFIRRGRSWYLNSRDEVKTIKREKSLSLEAAEKYLVSLQATSTEELEEILGIKDPIISRCEIYNATGNRETARIDVRIFIVNSFLDKSIYLSAVDNQWNVDRMEGTSDLYYERGEFLLKHDSSWEIYPSEHDLESLGEWVMNTAEGKTQAIFFIEEKGGNYSTTFTECLIKGVANCRIQILGEKEFKTAVYQEYIQAYVLEGPTTNLVALNVSGGSSKPLEDILPEIQIRNK